MDVPSISFSRDRLNKPNSMVRANMLEKAIMTFIRMVRFFSIAVCHSMRVSACYSAHEVNKLLSPLQPMRGDGEY